MGTSQRLASCLGEINLKGRYFKSFGSRRGDYLVSGGHVVLALSFNFLGRLLMAFAAYSAASAIATASCRSRLNTGYPERYCHPKRPDVRHRDAGRGVAACLSYGTHRRHSDPLPGAFAATLGRLVPLDGDVGVAFLLTLVVEIMNCFGLAAMRWFGSSRGGRRHRSAKRLSKRSRARRDSAGRPPLLFGEHLLGAAVLRHRLPVLCSRHRTTRGGRRPRPEGQFVPGRGCRQSAQLAAPLRN